MCDPAGNSSRIVASAARPDAKAKPRAPPSSAAMFASRAARVGLPERVYSHSDVKTPGAVW